MNHPPQFVTLKSINGDPMLVNIASVRAVSTINMAGSEVGVIAFSADHEVVVGSTVPEVLEAIEVAAGAVRA